MPTDLLVIVLQVDDAQTAEAKLRGGFEEQLPVMLQRKVHEVRAQLVTPKDVLATNVSASM